jgi:hypothetical protein
VELGTNILLVPGIQRHVAVTELDEPKESFGLTYFSPGPKLTPGQITPKIGRDIGPVGSYDSYRPDAGRIKPGQPFKCHIVKGPRNLSNVMAPEPKKEPSSVLVECLSPA